MLFNVRSSGLDGGGGSGGFIVEECLLAEERLFKDNFGSML